MPKVQKIFSNGKKIFSVAVLMAASVAFSGCSLLGAGKNVTGPMANATVIKSIDGGVSWQVKNKINEKKTLAGVDVLSIAVNPADPNIIYLGTLASGLFVSTDGAETWTQVAFADKAYGLVFDPQDSNVMYGTGVFNGRAKIFKRLKEGEEWKEVYTEPADGTVISSLAVSNANSQILFAGTSEGVIVKTVDGGLTWTNIKKVEGPVTGIVFDNSNENHLFFLVFQVGMFETKDSGKTIEDITQKVDALHGSANFYSIAVNPSLPGGVYVGTGGGIFEKDNGNDSWKPVNIIESSKAFPIRAVAANPFNPKEIVYASAQAVYKSIDGGKSWSIFQLDTDREVSVLKYDKADSNKIYAGLRKY